MRRILCLSVAAAEVAVTAAEASAAEGEGSVAEGLAVVAEAAAFVAALARRFPVAPQLFEPVVLRGPQCESVVFRRSTKLQRRWPQRQLRQRQSVRQRQFQLCPQSMEQRQLGLAQQRLLAQLGRLGLGLGLAVALRIRMGLSILLRL